MGHPNEMMNQKEAHPSTRVFYVECNALIFDESFDLLHVATFTRSSELFILPKDILMRDHQRDGIIRVKSKAIEFGISDQEGRNEKSTKGYRSHRY